MGTALIKTVTKTKAENMEDVCIIHKLHPEKQLRQNSFLYHCKEPQRRMQKNSGRYKGSCGKLIIFSSKVINFQHFAQTST